MRVSTDITITIDRVFLRKYPGAAEIMKDIINSREKAACRRDPIKSLLVPESHKLVVDAQGQRTIDGNKRKYAEKYNFDVSDQRYIQDNFDKKWEWTKKEYGVIIKEVMLVPVKQNGFDSWRAFDWVKKENIEAFDSKNSKELPNIFFSIKYQINGEQNPKTYYIPVGVGPFCFSLSDIAWYAGRGVVGDNTYWNSLQEFTRWAFYSRFCNKNR